MLKALILFAALIASTSVPSFAQDSKHSENFMGEYVQKGPIVFEGIENEAACKEQSSDTIWANDTCTSTTENSVTISKVKDLKETYYVQISILGPNLNSCTFDHEMTLVAGQKLIFTEAHPDLRDNCTLEIKKNKDGIELKDKTLCSLYYCGYGIGLGGTNEKFKRVNAGQEIFQAEESDTNE